MEWRPELAFDPLASSLELVPQRDLHVPERQARVAGLGHRGRDAGVAIAEARRVAGRRQGVAFLQAVDPSQGVDVAIFRHQAPVAVDQVQQVADIDLDLQLVAVEQVGNSWLN